MHLDLELRTTSWSLDRGVLTLVLDRPERGNAWTGRMEVEYRAVLGAAEASDDVAVVVVTGAGRHFCVGADARAVASTSERGYDPGVRQPLVEPGEATHPAYGTRHGFLLAMTKPIIAAVNGGAAGIGFAIACFADVRIVGDTAKLTTSTSRLGLPAEFGVSWVLPRLVGVARATHLLLGSPVVTGAEAAAMGLAHQAVPQAEVLATAQAYARVLVDECAPGAMAAVKRQLWDDLQRSLGDADQDATERLHAMVAQPDFAEGARALAAGERPRYGGRFDDQPPERSHRRD